MSPEEARGRYLAKQAIVGMIWFAVELAILAGVLKLAREDEFAGAWAGGVFLILLCYFEGRLRKK